MGQGVFYAARKYVGQFRCFEHLMVFCHLNCRFRNILTAFSFQCADRIYRGSDFSRQLLQINGVAVFVNQVHHIDGDDYRQTYFDQLSGQVQVPFQVGTVDDVQDYIRLFIDKIFSGYGFFQGIRRKGINAGKILNDYIVMAFQTAFFLFYGYAGPVAYILGTAGQFIEQCCFAAVGIAC